MVNSYDKLLTPTAPVRHVLVLSLGWGNVEAVRMFYKRCGYSADVLELRLFEPESEIDIAVIPGVGGASAFSDLSELVKLRLAKVLKTARTVVGICLGMHVLFRQLHEGMCSGLGLINLDVIGHNVNGTTVNNIGYRSVVLSQGKTSLYFCHSFGVLVSDLVVATDDIYTFFYPDGTKSLFAAGFKLNNIIGVQFHPEKSGLDGINIMKGFLDE